MELPVGLGRIDVSPKNVQQLVVRNLGRIVSHLNRFPVLGAVGGNFFIGCIIRATAGVTDDGFDNALGVIVRRLHAPETAPGENRCPKVACDGLRCLRHDGHQGEE